MILSSGILLIYAAAIILKITSIVVFPEVHLRARDGIDDDEELVLLFLFTGIIAPVGKGTWEIAEGLIRN